MSAFSSILNSVFLKNDFADVMNKKKYRHEFKYFAPEYILAELEKRCEVVLKRDSHTGSSGFYNIKSLYFDDFANTCYYENENGTDPREKFRIRIYNNSTSRITLELKQKKQGMTLKTSTPIAFERLQAIIHGGKLDVKNEDSFLYKKFYEHMLSRNLRPVTIVVYDRVPFVYKEGNVRVTFDRNIRSGNDFSKFFDAYLPVRPVLPADTNLLEVKFDEFLPDYIYEILQTGRLSQTSFSKYYLCRKFNMKGTIK